LGSFSFASLLAKLLKERPMLVDFYEPDGWVIVKFMPVDAPTFYKIFGTWRGGYLDGDTWRMSSGSFSPQDAELHEGVITWPQTSGSIYKLRVEDENCTTFYTGCVLDNIVERSKANGIDCELIRFNDT
jgi:hypothetical protein